MNKFTENLDKIDDWITAGDNWRFISVVGISIAIVAVLVFGAVIRHNMQKAAVGITSIPSAMVATMDDAPKEPVVDYDDAADDVKTIIQNQNEAAGMPIPNRKLAKRWQRKAPSDLCYKLKGNNTLERCRSASSDDMGPLYSYIMDRGK